MSVKRVTLLLALGYVLLSVPSFIQQGLRPSLVFAILEKTGIGIIAATFVYMVTGSRERSDPVLDQCRSLGLIRLCPRDKKNTFFDIIDDRTWETGHTLISD